MGLPLTTRSSFTEAKVFQGLSWTKEVLMSRKPSEALWWINSITECTSGALAVSVAQINVRPTSFGPDEDNSSTTWNVGVLCTPPNEEIVNCPLVENV